MKQLKTLRIEKELVDQLKASAAVEHRTFTNKVISILKDWSEKQKAA